MRTTILASLFIASGYLSAQSPGQTPAFRSRVDLVEVDAVVRDKSGNPVRGLTRDDFQVFEDGKPMAIETFTAIDLPPAPQGSVIGRPDSSLLAFGSNDYPEDGRLFLIVIDDFEIRFDAHRRVKTQRVARRLIERLAPGDLAAVVATSSSRDVALEFTNDKPRLMAAVNEFFPSGEGQAPDLVSSTDSGNTTFGSLKTTFAMGKLRGVAKTLALVQHRRKAVVLVSEGPPFGIEDVMSPDAGISANASTALEALREFIQTAQRSNVAVYAFDANDQTESGLSDRRQNLRSISEGTGGFATVFTDNVEPAVDRMVAENGSYYFLGYRSPAKPYDGKHHRIQVKLARPGLEVSAREGYVSPKSAPKLASTPVAPLDALLAAPLQERGLPMHVSVVPAPSAQKGRTALAVTIEVPAGSFKDSRSVEIIVNAVNLETAKVEAARKLEGSLPGRDNLTGWVRFATRLELKPDRVQLRITSRLSDGSQQGSVFTEVRVPTLDSALSLGGLTLGTHGGAFDHAKVEALLGVIPVPDREIPASIPLLIGLPIRVDPKLASDTIAIALSAIAPDGHVLSTQQSSKPASTYASGDGGAFVAPLPVNIPGDNRLRVEASLPGKKPVVRELTFKRN